MKKQKTCCISMVRKLVGDRTTKSRLNELRYGLQMMQHCVQPLKVHLSQQHWDTKKWRGTLD